MIELPRTYRTSFWVIGIVLAGLGISVAGFLLFKREPDEVWVTLGFGGLVVAFALGLADCLTSRVRLTADSLEVRSNFKRKVLLASEVVRVVAEKGAPVALQLRRGGWFHLPSLGTGPHPNTLRAWASRREKVGGERS